MAKVKARIVDFFEGQAPFIITVRDDGRLNSLDGEKGFPFTRKRRPNDIGTSELAERINSIQPGGIYFLFQNVERKRMANIIRYYFYERVLEAARLCLAKWGKCWVLDIHSFTRHRMDEPYDIIFGTDNRKTVPDDFDKKFAACLAANWPAVRIFVPGEERRSDEYYCAHLNSSLVCWLANRESRISGLQVEIYASWLSTRQNQYKLSRIIFNAIDKFLRENW